MRARRQSYRQVLQTLVFSMPPFQGVLRWRPQLTDGGLRSPQIAQQVNDNAVAESVFNLLKRERVRRRTYKTRDQGRQDIFDYIEMFYNPIRKHVRNGMLSPVDFENRQFNVNQEGVEETRDYSSIPVMRFRTCL